MAKCPMPWQREPLSLRDMPQRVSQIRSPMIDEQGLHAKSWLANTRALFFRMRLVCDWAVLDSDSFRIVPIFSAPSNQMNGISDFR